ncbi:hypothetical protein PG989_005567 [Apiospora arundinis]
MRFGQYFHRLINPEFEPYYIDYNQRKASIKELRLIDQNLGGAYQLLQDDLSKIEKFHTTILDQ